MSTLLALHVYLWNDENNINIAQFIDSSTLTEKTCHENEAELFLLVISFKKEIVWNQFENADKITHILHRGQEYHLFPCTHPPLKTRPLLL